MPKTNIKPEATSTPKLLYVAGRKGIKDHEYEGSPQSAIYETGSPKIVPYKLRSGAGKEKSPNFRRQQDHLGSINRSYSRSPHHSPSRHRSHSPSGTSSDDEHNCSEEETSENIRHNSFGVGQVNQNNDSSVDSNSNFNLDTYIENAEKEFPQQDKDFWLYIKSNLKEIHLLKQPKTILFLYEANSEHVLNKVLEKVSDIAVCHLRDCKHKPVLVNGDTLNKSEFVIDYGKIISKYQNGLEKNGVFVVKNFEKVPGTVAQAFHSICDDYHPVVQNALIVFTVKVEKIPEKVYRLKFLENLFLKLWNDIGVDDKFYPLFTRVTGTVLAVNSANI